jgi:hypothetical protein
MSSALARPPSCLHTTRAPRRPRTRSTTSSPKGSSPATLAGWPGPCRPKMCLFSCIRCDTPSITPSRTRSGRPTASSSSSSGATRTSASASVRPSGRSLGASCRPGGGSPLRAIRAGRVLAALLARAGPSSGLRPREQRRDRPGSGGLRLLGRDRSAAARYSRIQPLICCGAVEVPPK